MTPEEINSCLSCDSSTSVSWWLHFVYWSSCYRDFLLICINGLSFFIVGVIGFILTRYFTKRRNEYESFQSYLSNIKDILTKESISDNNKEQIKLIIKALTEEVISSVDEERIRKVFNFLADASLIQKKAYPEIKELKVSQILKSIELKNIDLRNMEKLTDVDFSNSKLSNISFNNSNLTGAKFDSATLVNVDFRKAIVKDVTFKGATIQEKIWLDNKLTIDGDLTGIKMNKAIFYGGKDALKGIILKGAFIENTRFDGMNFQRTRWENSNFKETNFQSSNLSNSEFIDCDLENPDFSWPTTLDNVKFLKCKINESAFSTPMFSSNKFIFHQSRLTKITFKTYRTRHGSLTVNLSGSIFKDCELSEIEFNGRILEKVDFSGSKIINSNFKGANLVDADLSKTIIDDKTSFKNALYSENTKFPQDFSPIEHEMKKVD